jgi:3-phenylpropionate/trans-cinnamate dioxygenase ferredoxin subunit
MSDEARWTVVGAAEDLPPGTMHDFPVSGETSVLVANCDGRLYAIEDRCTHDDGPLAEGEMIEGCKVECPRHGALFDMQTGKALTLPATRPVASFPVRINDDGEIEVDLNVEPPSPPRPRRRPFGQRGT